MKCKPKVTESIETFWLRHGMQDETNKVAFFFLHGESIGYAFRGDEFSLCARLFFEEEIKKEKKPCFIFCCIESTVNIAFHGKLARFVGLFL